VFAGKKRMGAERAEENGGIFFPLYLFIYLFFYVLFFAIYA